MPSHVLLSAFHLSVSIASTRISVFFFCILYTCILFIIKRSSKLMLYSRFLKHLVFTVYHFYLSWLVSLNRVRVLRQKPHKFFENLLYLELFLYVPFAEMALTHRQMAVIHQHQQQKNYTFIFHCL